MSVQARTSETGILLHRSVAPQRIWPELAKCISAAREQRPLPPDRVQLASSASGPMAARVSTDGVLACSVGSDPAMVASYISTQIGIAQEEARSEDGTQRRVPHIEMCEQSELGRCSMGVNAGDLLYTDSTAGGRHGLRARTGAHGSRQKHLGSYMTTSIANTACRIGAGDQARVCLGYIQQLHCLLMIFDEVYGHLTGGSRRKSWKAHWTETPPQSPSCTVASVLGSFGDVYAGQLVRCPTTSVEFEERNLAKKRQRGRVSGNAQYEY
jgi:hypothetical protein